MADIKITVYPNKGNIRAMMMPNGMVGSALLRAADLTVRRAKRNVRKYGRIKTGLMMLRIHKGNMWVTDQGPRIQVSTGTFYSRFQHDGTRFIKPAPFITDAVRELKPGDFRPR